MRTKKLLLPAIAVGAAAILLAPNESTAFTTIGGSLNLNQRDFRVRNIFADVSANNNGADDPQFPSYNGADLAIWKGTVEWGSGRHGDGSGDPTQPQIGNGGANFDPTWQGTATGIGGPDDNIISASSTNPGCGGGTLAFTLGPISNGWQIVFCDSGILWEDGPGTIGGGSFDIQEVQTHEYGHALGLGHSADPNATMRPGTPPGSVVQRSINLDDIAGVQFIYGVKDTLVKPLITAITGVGTITIVGDNFDATNNEVWFTQIGAGGTGNPVKQFSVASTGSGTQISVAFPAAAGPGDIIVRIPGSGHDRLSNAFPYDPVVPPPVTYCTGKVNTDLCVPFMSFVGGPPSVTSTDSFSIRCEDVSTNQNGIMIYGTTGRGNLNFHNAKLCVKAPLIRLLPPKNSGDDGSPFCAGSFKKNFNKRIQSGVDPNLTSGQIVNAQYIYRDPGIDAFNDGLSDGIEFTIAP